jgi:hypothetical protein
MYFYFFSNYTIHPRDTHNTRILIPMNTRTRTLPLGASSKTVPANPQDWRSHHRRLAVDENVAYHWQPQRTHTHPYKYTHANHTLRSIFEDCAGKSSRLTKSPQASRCRRERRLPLKAQTPLNPEKFALTENRTQDLRCYRSSCNH